MMGDDEKIRHWLQEQVKTHWEKHSRVLLLSEIGPSLREAFPNYSEFMPKGLKDFLSRWPVAQLIQHPLSAQKIGLIPLSEGLPDDVGRLFHSSSHNPNHTIYVAQFWKAFTQPIRGRRFVSIRPTGEVIVQDTKTPSSELFAKEILESDLGPLNANMSPAEKGKITHDKIQSWLMRNGVSQDEVTEKGKALLRGGFDLAEQIGNVLIALSPEEQSRISVPLDVVLSIIKKLK